MRPHVIVVAVIVLLGVATFSRATSLTHEYLLNGSFTDTLGGASLVPNGGAIGASGYSFSAGQGLSGTGAINATSYTLEFLLTPTGLDGIRRLVEFKNLSSDDGVYAEDGRLSLYPHGAAPSAALFPGTPAHVTLTRDGMTGLAAGYVNGVLQFSIDDALTGYATFTGPGNVFWLFRDNTSGGFTGEDLTSGFVDFVRIYDGALTSDKVSACFGGIAVESASQAGDCPGLASATAVPEPATGALLVIGLAALARRRLNNRR